MDSCKEKLNCCSIKCPSDKFLCCTLIAIFSAIFVGIIGPLTLNALLDNDINYQVIIDGTDSPNFDAWQTNTQSDSSLDINYLLYFFDTQNPEDVLIGAKPAVIQKGPYAFNEYYSKFDIEWTDDGDTVMKIILIQ